MTSSTRQAPNHPTLCNTDIFLFSNFLFIFVFSIIMTVAYTGNLVAFMTDPGLQAPLDTPEKILEKDLPIGMYNYQARARSENHFFHLINHKCLMKCV
jgi:hypothetical protein